MMKEGIWFAMLAVFGYAILSLQGMVSSDTLNILAIVFFVMIVFTFVGILDKYLLRYFYALVGKKG